MKKNLLSLVCLLTVMLLSSGLGFAQDAAKNASKDAPKKPESSENDIGNLRRTGIDVVQNRVFIKSHRHEFGLGAGFIFDNPFQRYETAEFKYLYHLRETIAIEASYAYAFSQDKSIIRDLANIPCDSPPTLFDASGSPIADCGVILNPAPDPYKHIFNGNLVWAPIYGKFSIFSKKILHFDVFATAGAGYYMADRDNRFGFNIGVGSRVFLNQWSAVRIDFRNFTIKEGAPFNHIVNNRILSVGMSFFLPTRVEREQ